jgi:hypothetical protein
MEKRVFDLQLKIYDQTKDFHKESFIQTTKIECEVRDSDPRWRLLPQLKPRSAWEAPVLTRLD